MRFIVVVDKSDKKQVFAVRFHGNALAFFEGSQQTAEQQNKQLEQLAFACYQIYKNRDVDLIDIISLKKQVTDELSVGCFLNLGGSNAASDGYAITLDDLNQDSSTHRFVHNEVFPHIERILIKEKFLMEGRDPSQVGPQPNPYLDYRLQFLGGFDTWKDRFKPLLNVREDRLKKLGALRDELAKKFQDNFEVRRIQAFIDKEELMLEGLLPMPEIDAKEQQRRVALFANKTVLTAVYTAALEIYNNYVLAADEDQSRQRKEQFSRVFKSIEFSDEHGQLLPLTEDSLNAPYSPSLAIEVHAILVKLQKEKIKWSSSRFSRSTYAATLLEGELEQAVNYINDEYYRFLRLKDASPFGVTKGQSFDLIQKQPVFDENAIDAEVTEIFTTKLGLTSGLDGSGAERGWQEVYSEVFQALVGMPNAFRSKPVFEPVSAEEPSSVEAVASNLLASSSSSSSTADTATPLKVSANNVPVEEQAPNEDMSEAGSSLVSSPSSSGTVTPASSLSVSTDNLKADVAPRRKGRQRRAQIADAPTTVRVIDYASLLDNMQKHLELSVWGRKGVFGASWVGGTSEAIPESIKRIKAILLDPNPGVSAVHKFAHIKHIAQQAVDDDSPRRLEATKAYLATFNQSDKEIFDYFAAQAVANEDASISALLTDLKSFIEDVDWEITKGPMPRAIQFTQPDGLLVEKFVPKHVADQHEVLTKHFNRGVNTEADSIATFQKVEKIALKACHEGNRNRSQVTANYYAIFNNPRFELKDKIAANKKKIETRPQDNATCLEELRALYDHIRNTQWEVRGWFFIKRFVHLNAPGGGQNGRPDQLPEHIKSQYLKIEALLHGKSKDDPLTVFEKVQKIAAQANAKSSRNRKQEAIKYYEAFMGIEKPQDIREKLIGRRQPNNMNT